MKKLLINVLIFVLILAIMDYIVGSTLERMYFSLERGPAGARINHLLSQKYDVYVMGASTAKYGYVPEVIGKNLNASVFNVGEDSANIIYSYALLQIILDTHKPKMIVWDVSNGDYYYHEGRSQSNYFMPYSDNATIRDLLIDIEPYNRFALKSKLYTYNQKILPILTTYIGNNRKGHQNGGYEPLYGKIKPEQGKDYSKEFTEATKKREKNKASSKQNTMVQKYFESFISLCKRNDIALVAVYSPKAPVSPELYSKTLLDNEIVRQLSILSVPLLMVLPSSYPALSDLNLYKDVAHLNDAGARIFSKIVADSLSNYYKH